MPIDIDQLKLLVKLASAIQPDKGSQAMAAAAAAAKPAGGISLPKPIEEESPAEGALSAEQQQREQEKLEQQRRKEIEAKENEIRGLQHELDLERVERQKMTNRHELDMQVRQEEAKLKAEKDKLEQERFQLVQEKARQDNIMKAEEMKHQATLDKATYKQEAAIAKAQAKSTADLAKQQAQTLIATNEKARKASDKYYADATAKLTSEHPAISPALQQQLDGAIASLDRFKKVNSKQTALPKPGTPPDFTKLASVVKWASSPDDFFGPSGPSSAVDYTLPPAELRYYAPQPAAQPTRVAPTTSSTPSSTHATASAESEVDPEQAELERRGVKLGGSAYDALRATAYFRNEQSKYEHKGDKEKAKYYERLGNTAHVIAVNNYATASKGDRAAFDSYLDTKTTANGFDSHKAYHTTESQFDRDAGAFRDQLAKEKYERETGSFKKGLLWVADLFGDIYAAPHNAITDAAASSRNADRFGANRFWNTTFDDDSVSDYYHRAINEQGYSDSVAADVGRVAGEGALSVISAIPVGKGAVILGKGGAKLLSGAARSGAGAVARAGTAAATTGASTAARAGAGTAAKAGAGAAASTGAGAAASAAGTTAAAETAATIAPKAGLGRFVGPAAKLTGTVAAYGAAKYGLDQLAPRPSGTPGYDPGLINLGPPAGYGYTDPANMVPAAQDPYDTPRSPGIETDYARGLYEDNPNQYFNQFYDPMSYLDNPGTLTLTKRASNNLIAQMANKFYGHSAFNSAMLNPVYSSNAKFVSELVRAFTGGLINPYMQIKKHDMFVNPRLPLTATNLMHSTVYEAGNKGRSNMHKVVANAAEQKHNPSYTPENYNGATYRPQPVAGRR